MGFCLFRPLRSSSLPAPAIRHRRGGPAVRASLLLLLALPCRAGAQHPTDTLAVDGSYDIEEIVVTARRATEIIPTQKLEGKALEELNSHSVADALRYFSGIQIKDYGGIGGLKTVNIRSMGSQHVGVFFDGIQIGNAQNGTVDLGRFSLDNMEAISVYNGQKSSIFQSAKDFASASALYMETRRPRFDSIRTDNFKATLKGGSFKTVNPSLLWEHKFGRRIRSSLNTEYMYTSGEYRFSYAKADGYDTTEVRKNGDVRLFRAEAALFGDLDDGEWRAKAYFYDSERGYPGYIDRNTLIESFRISSAAISRLEAGPAHIDGEPAELGKVINVECRPASLRILAPDKESPFRPIISPVKSFFDDIRYDLRALIRRQ